MRKLLLLAAIGAVAAIPTAVQGQTVTTSCYERKKGFHCRSTVRPSVSETISAISNAKRRGRVRADGSIDTGRSIEGERILAAIEAERGPAHLDPRNHSWEAQRVNVTQRITNNDCSGARAYAVKSENPYLIKHVEEFCGKASGQ